MEKKVFTRQFPIFRGVVFALILKSKLALAELDAVQIEINCERKRGYSVWLISALSAALPLYR